MHQKMTHGPASDFVERVHKQILQMQPMKDRLKILQQQRQLCLDKIKTNDNEHCFNDQLAKIDKDIQGVTKSINRMRQNCFRRTCRPGLHCTV